MIDQDLIKAYKQTNYIFSGITLNVGQPLLEAAHLLEDYKPKGGLFITAWNPLGEVATDDENRDANQKLKLDLLSRGLKVLEGYGESPNGEWREDSYFTYPVTEQTCLELCNRYKQNAVVFVTSNGMPKLLLNPRQSSVS